MVESLAQFRARMMHAQITPEELERELWDALGILSHVRETDRCHAGDDWEVEKSDGRLECDNG
jgi:hypothetical protein